MAYTKQTWNNGDVITADKMNHMEDGIANGGAMVVNMTYDESADAAVLDKTWQEIYNILASGALCVVCSVNSLQSAGVWLVTNASYNLVQNKYEVIAVGVTFHSFTTTTTDGYPTSTM